jgi:hypothetical protein
LAVGDGGWLVDDLGAALWFFKKNLGAALEHAIALGNQSSVIEIGI